MKIKVTIGTLSTAIEAIEVYKKRLESKQKEFTSRLAEIGVNTATVAFANAQYDGTNDVKVLEPFWEGEKLIIKAVGNAVTFIEFGSGVHSEDTHEKSAEMGMNRGEFGKGIGKKDSWTYYGELGTDGKFVRESDKGTVVRTHGNPPARAMYEAGKQMRSQIAQIAKEVFNGD